MRTAWLWLWLSLAACYAPSAPSGAPCAPAAAGGARCPSDQRCVLLGGVETCMPPGGAGGGDAATDGPADAVDGPPDDLDNDGVPNASDGCPAEPDPMQYDEDGDGVGDVCDPCPVSSSDADADGDGVGDDCDPNPMIGGDAIVLFDGLNQGVPAGWTPVGNWAAVAGAVSVTVGAGVDATLSPPFDVDATSTVAAAFVSGNNVPITNAGFGVAHAAQGEGVLCGLVTDGGRLLALIDIDVDDFLDIQPSTWANQTTYVTGQVRSASRYRCTAIDPQGASQTVEALHPVVPSQARIQLRSRGTSGRFLWLLHVDSP